MTRSHLAGTTLALAVVAIACGGAVRSKNTGAGATNGAGGMLGTSSGGGASSGGSGGALGSGASGSVIRQNALDKVDLLFMIDNSASMGDKQKLLAAAVPDLITRLVQPNCIDNIGNVVGQSDSMGNCSAATGGRPEFPAVHDMHIGIVTSSLGGRGASTTCPADMFNDANSNLNAHNDDRGELVNRGGDNETPVTSAQPFNFLTWFPPVGANKQNGITAQPATGPETQIGDVNTPGTLIGDFAAMVRGVHEHGCGFEAQNEAWYRFLAQPDPFDGINGIQIGADNRATLVGLDSRIVQQRAAFLRPDSLLAVIVVTDENEEVANPLSVGGEGWLYEAAPFPSSPTYGAPEGTIECQTNPTDPNCTSCAFRDVQSAPNFAQRCPNDPPWGMQGFLDPGNDNVNVRFFNQKQRFGVFAGYPTSRYVRALQKRTVPDRAHEVDGDGNYVGDQDKYANCINPIYAQNLPTDPKADLCHLQQGPRTSDLVYYAAIAGVPHQLLQAQAGIDAECPAGTNQADCPQKNQLTELDWLAITGKDPENYDFSGVDPHMLESETPRSGLTCNQYANDNCDSINGREWDTSKKDLQFSCIFPLVDPSSGTPSPKDCTQMAYKGACDCDPASNSRNTPLCQTVNGRYTTMQINGKAYPSVREMVIARQMAASAAGVQGIASSICPIHTDLTASPTDPLFGYRPAANAIVNRLKISLAAQCLPQKLTTDKTNETVNCQIIVTLNTGDQSVCQTVQGLQPVDPNVLSKFRPAQEAAWNQAGGTATGLPDPKTLPVCALQQLSPKNPKFANDFDATGSCLGSKDSGWCYVEGTAAGSCPQQIIFTNGEPPLGAIVNLVCPQ
jgi:hypothetical protein